MQSFISYSGYGYSKLLCEDVTTWFLNKFFPRHKLDVEILHRGLKREGVEDLQYWEQPHEIFAFWNEKILYQEYVAERTL